MRLHTTFTSSFFYLDTLKIKIIVEPQVEDVNRKWQYYEYNVEKYRILDKC